MLGKAPYARLTVLRPDDALVPLGPNQDLSWSITMTVPLKKPILGLNPFSSSAKKEVSFGCFQWVLPGTLARSTQPGYTGTDNDHTVKPFDVTFLRLKKIVCIISANSRDMLQGGRDLLKDAGIDFYQFKLVDFTAPTPAQLRTVADLIEHNRTRPQNPGATLIYCGAGQGRTGTYVAGWAMLKYLDNVLDRKLMLSLGFLWRQFGVERPEQALAVKAVVTGQRLSQVSMPGNVGLAAFNGVPDTFSGPANAHTDKTAEAESKPSNLPLPSFGSGNFQFGGAKFFS